MRKRFGWMAALWTVLAICAALAPLWVLATPLADNRNTPEIAGRTISLTVKNDEVIYAGSIVSVDSSGEAVAATDASGDVVVGRAQSYVNNADDGATIEVRRGVFLWANGGTFTDANIGDLAYVEDDQTVTTAASVTHDIVAGIIVDVDSLGVWVDTYAIGGQGAASVTTLNASGAAALGSTLSVAGNTTIGSNKVVITAASGNIVTKGTLGAGANGTEFTVSAAGNTAVAGTLGVTGLATFTLAPKLVSTNAPGAVAAAVLANLPTGATTNAIFGVFTIGAINYVVPMYALP